jgi:hypothetical protein
MGGQEVSKGSHSKVLGTPGRGIFGLSDDQPS